MSDRFVVHGVVDLRLLAWLAAETDDAQDRLVQRNDRYGHPIRWEDYENEESQFGWFIELIDPEDSEFGSNLRPVSYRGRKLDDYNDTDTDGA